MAEFKGLDFYNTDKLLTDEERMARDTVRDFVSAEVMPVIRQHYQDGTFPRDLIPKMGELGLLGSSLSGYGCAGMSKTAYGLIMQELERGDSGIRSFASVQGSLVMYPIHTFGSEEQKKKYLPPLAEGKMVGCFGLTEHDAGSDPGGMTTRAVKNGDGYILNGAKMWITNGSMADVAVVWAKMHDDTIGGFIVERGMKGFATNEVKGKLSLRASDTAELVFEDCLVPERNRMPNTSGLKSPLMCLTQARYGIAWGVMGSAMACYDEALQYAKTRVQFGKPIASFQIVQEKLVRMLTEITKGQLLCFQLGRLMDNGEGGFDQVSLAKRNNVFQALQIARMSRDILGASGITDEYQAMRHMCNLESVYTYEGTHDIHTLILGERITGISAFA
ncbi:MAG: acyl-CoA dehydrogenase [Planctomycetes bacterium RBG_16_59_8]|nr:MAG: acyl-CoA dehydrogenase [Planctomycetes bacterium RBG_16_59_8]